MIGRTTGDFTCAEDSRMSGKHALVSVETSEGLNSVFIEDLGSKNRTSVNRVEIPPQQKTKLKMFSYIEIGAQYFILTESKNISIQDLNDVVEMQQKKQLVKLEDEKTKSEIKILPTVNPYDEIKAKEASLLELQQEITNIETNARSELQKLDEAKAKLVAEAKEQRSALSKRASALKIEIEETKAHLEKVRTELEQRKKKIINLKDIPSD